MHFRWSNRIRDENDVFAESATRVTLELINLGIVRRAEIGGVRMRPSLQPYACKWDGDTFL